MSEWYEKLDKVTANYKTFATIYEQNIFKKI